MGCATSATCWACRGATLTGLLDTTPLRETVRRAIDFGRLRRNVEAGLLDAAAVVGTSAATSRSVVFVDGRPVPSEDVGQGIDYVAARLDDEHLRASAAIPVLFPPVYVSDPARARGWYVDGGARLNAPIRPALSLGADRVVVVGLNAVAPPTARLASDERPDAFEVAGVFLQGALVNPLVQDVRTLARTNRLLGDRRDELTAPDGWDYRPVPFIFITPRARGRVAGLAERVFDEHYAGLEARRSIDVALLARLIGGAGAGHGALLSYLFFAPEFAAALIELGRADARRWLAAHSGPGGPWELDSADPVS